LQKGSSAEFGLVESYQIRFTNDTEYVVELVCRGFRLDPINVSEGKLPPFVKKVPGTGGLIWGQQPSGVVLEVFGRQQTVLVDNEQLNYSYEPNIYTGVTPITTCQGFGYSCCSPETTEGQGESYQGVSDCPRTCYAQCKSRPVVLSFTAEPYMDAERRTVQAAKNEPVTFNYVLSGQAPLTGTIVFGDGQSAPLTAQTGTVSHAYTCAAASCQFTAQLQVLDKVQTPAAATPLTKMQITVQ
jgi:hypothetical protein